MKIARIQNGGGAHTALIVGESVRVLPGVSVLELLAADGKERERLAGQGREEVALADVRLLSPIQPPSVRDFSVFEQHGEGAVMFFAGLEAKVQEAWYEGPAFYFSNPHATTGPGDVIEPPAIHSGLDLELEVAAIVSRRARNISVEDAAAHIAGYTIFNDWSERDIAAKEARLPFGFHKTKDFANTFGPWIVTPDELEVYREGDRLNLRCAAFINDEPLGEDSLTSMAWSFEELVHFAARGAWIAPGDVIGSGTVGNGCLFELWGRHQAKQPRPLEPGDEVRLEVEGIGTLTNTIGQPQPDLPALPRARARTAA
jgi:2-keto-4-pentenoate hydratase/2-oxohepta-3-ene-1,7-dioic acid hydratase in catechol pathway